MAYQCIVVREYRLYTRIELISTVTIFNLDNPHLDFRLNGSSDLKTHQQTLHCWRRHFIDQIFVRESQTHLGNNQRGWITWSTLIETFYELRKVTP